MLDTILLSVKLLLVLFWYLLVGVLVLAFIAYFAYWLNLLKPLGYSPWKKEKDRKK